jgi:hypothetical protein
VNIIFVFDGEMCVRVKQSRITHFGVKIQLKNSVLEAVLTPGNHFEAAAALDGPVEVTTTY